jgi:antitoxin component YwqK of YwqJK toxin-antitoxin module
MKKITLSLVLSLILAYGASAQNIILKDGLYYSDNSTLYSGVYNTYFETGEKESIITVTNGKIQGTATYYYTNGTVMETGSFENNEKNGQWLRWDELGNKIAEAFYVTGKKDGTWLIWDSKGVKRFEMFYSMGEKKGTWSMWDENGKLLNEKNYNPS